MSGNLRFAAFIVVALVVFVFILRVVLRNRMRPPRWRRVLTTATLVVVGGMGSLGGAVAAGFLLGILQSFASMNEVKSIFPGIDQIIIYLVAVIILLVRPRGLMGRRGVMEE